MTEEKIIIHSKQSKTFKKTCLVVTVVLFSLMLICLPLAFRFARENYVKNKFGYNYTYAEYMKNINEDIEYMKKHDYPSEYIKDFKKGSKIKLGDYSRYFF